MNKEKIEELAFKDRKELANLNELDLLEIIEFLQLDRKQWINQYSAAHNDYVDLQQENKKLKENQKYKEGIDKLIKYLQEKYDSSSLCGIVLNFTEFEDIKDLLKEVK